MPDASAAYALELLDVEKQYGALRPLRIRNLQVAPATRVALTGFDAASAEVFVNLASGATLPDKGDIITLGQPTSQIANGDAWLTFVERIGIFSGRIVLLEAMTIAQNLALPFGLELDPIPPSARPRVTRLADELEIDPSSLDMPVGNIDASARAKVGLARALAFDPEILLLEHPAIDPRLLTRISERRALTVVALTADQAFAKDIRGRLLSWQPASGELRESRRWF